MTEQLITQSVEDTLNYVAQNTQDFPLVPFEEALSSPRRSFIQGLALRFPHILNADAFKLEQPRIPKIENIGQFFAALREIPSLSIL